MNQIPFFPLIGVKTGFEFHFSGAPEVLFGKLEDVNIVGQYNDLRVSSEISGWTTEIGSLYQYPEVISEEK